MWFHLQSVIPGGVGTFQRKLMLLAREVRVWKYFNVLLLVFSVFTIYVYAVECFKQTYRIDAVTLIRSESLK